jgi:uncharacterized protein YgfB (UPF0149 family)
MTEHYTNLIYKITTEAYTAFPEELPQVLTETLQAMEINLSAGRFASGEWLANWCIDFLAI